MSNGRVRFIGRTTEIELILAAVFDWNTQQVLFIYGTGGVGKTSLLRETKRRLTQKSRLVQHLASDGRQLRVIDIDLDDIHKQSADEISSVLIAQGNVDDSGRRRYVEQLRLLQEYQQTHSPMITEQRRKVSDTVAEEYNQASRNARTAIFCDTTDSIRTDSGREALNHLLALSKKLNNTITLFSGKNADDLYRKYEGDGAPVLKRPVPVEPLLFKDGLRYLRLKRKQLGIVINPDMERKILLLSGGIPFLIDLAAGWLARQMPLLWLSEQSIDALQTMSPEEAKTKQDLFRASLVQHIQQLQSPLDRLTLTLAWVHPIDVPLCAKLLDLSKQQAHDLIAYARKNLAFIKPLPNGEIKLHDYMQELVQIHVGNNVDEERRKRDNERASEYFADRRRPICRDRDSLVSALNTTPPEAPTFHDLFLKKEAKEREYWEISARLLDHQLSADTDRGVRLFCALFDEAQKLQKVHILNYMLTQALTYKNRLAGDNWVDLSSRQAQYLVDNAQEYLAAESVWNEILNYAELSDAQRAMGLLGRGNARVRIRDNYSVELALRDFDEAREYARQGNDLPAVFGLAELEVGWAYSSRGDFTKANTHFENAADLAFEARDQELQAKVLNELAYTKAASHPATAIWLCNRAVERWGKLQDRPGLGRAYSNMGTILYRMGDYGKALDYFERAREIFEPVNDDEWIGIISSWEGIAICAQAEMLGNTEQAVTLLGDAEKLLREALAIDVHLDRARNHNRLARILDSQGRKDDAWRELWKAYNASIEIPDFVYEVASVRDLSLVALQLKIADVYEDLRVKLNRCERQGIPLGPHGMGYGNALVNLGVMGIYLGDAEWGFPGVASGLRFCAEAGSYANYSFTRTLQTLRQLAGEYVAPNERQELGNYLRRYWENNNLNREFIEATMVFRELMP